MGLHRSIIASYKAITTYAWQYDDRSLFNGFRHFFFFFNRCLVGCRRHIYVELSSYAPSGAGGGGCCVCVKERYTNTPTGVSVVLVNCLASCAYYWRVVGKMLEEYIYLTRRYLVYSKGGGGEGGPLLLLSCFSLCAVADATSCCEERRTASEYRRAW